MILCCGTYHMADEVYILKPSHKYTNRKLEIMYECPSKSEICHAYIAELVQTNISTKERFTIRRKNKVAKDFVQSLLKEVDYVPGVVSHGSKSNMNWVYGENKEIKNKKGQIIEIRQIAVDFNNKKKITKHIYLPLNNNSAQ